MKVQAKSVSRGQVVILERTYQATVEELWDLWATKEGFESWWGPEGFRVEVHALEPRVGGRLHYDMIADTPEMVRVMKQMGRPVSHAAHATFSVFTPHERLSLTNVIDFLPGVPSYESTIGVTFIPAGDRVRMVVTLEPMHDEEFTKMSRQGFSSQLRKLDQRFAQPVREALPRTKIMPHFWYASQALEAATYYASIFPDSHVESVTTLMSESPSGPPGTVKVVDFTLFGQPFQAITAGPHHEFNDAVSMVVLCDDQAELDRYWSALLEGGGKAQACGWLIDRFGLRWQIVPARVNEMIRDQDAARSKRVSDAIMNMVKLDLATLEAAYRS